MRKTYFENHSGDYQRKFVKKNSLCYLKLMSLINYPSIHKVSSLILKKEPSFIAGEKKISLISLNWLHSCVAKLLKEKTNLIIEF